MSFEYESHKALVNKYKLRMYSKELWGFIGMWNNTGVNLFAIYGVGRFIGMWYNTGVNLKLIFQRTFKSLGGCNVIQV